METVAFTAQEIITVPCRKQKMSTDTETLTEVFEQKVEKQTSLNTLNNI